MRRRTTWAVLAVLAGLALVAGCASSDDGGGDSASDVGNDIGGDVDAAGGSEGGADEATGGGDGDLGAQAPPAEDPARIIYTSDLRVRVDDPAAAARQAIDLVEEAGGSLAAQSEVEGEDLVVVTVRVPVGGFRSVLDALAELGTVLDRHVEAEDVTDRVVDLEGRLENARASADRLRELYATATDVEQIVAIEQALTEREAEVESLAGQLQQLEDRADRSTITVTFVDEGEPVADEEEDDDANAFVRGVRAGRDLLVGLGTVLAAVAGFLLPLLPLLLLGGAVVWFVTRRARRRARTAPAPPTAAGRPRPPTPPAAAPPPTSGPPPPPPPAPDPTAPPPQGAEGKGWGAPPDDEA